MISPLALIAAASTSRKNHGTPSQDSAHTNRSLQLLAQQAGQKTSIHRGPTKPSSAMSGRNALEGTQKNPRRSRRLQGTDYVVSVLGNGRISASSPSRGSFRGSPDEVQAAAEVAGYLYDKYPHYQISPAGKGKVSVSVLIDGSGNQSSTFRGTPAQVITHIDRARNDERQRRLQSLLIERRRQELWSKGIGSPDLVGSDEGPIPQFDHRSINLNLAGQNDPDVILQEERSRREVQEANRKAKVFHDIGESINSGAGKAARYASPLTWMIPGAGDVVEHIGKTAVSFLNPISVAESASSVIMNPKSAAVDTGLAINKIWGRTDDGRPVSLNDRIDGLFALGGTALGVLDIANLFRSGRLRGPELDEAINRAISKGVLPDEVARALGSQGKALVESARGRKTGSQRARPPDFRIISSDTGLAERLSTKRAGIRGGHDAPKRPAFEPPPSHTTTTKPRGSQSGASSVYGPKEASQYIGGFDVRANRSRTIRVRRSGDFETAQNPRLEFERPDGSVWILGRGKTSKDLIREHHVDLPPGLLTDSRRWFNEYVPGFLDRGYSERHAIADALANQNVPSDVARGTMFRVEDQMSGIENSGGAGLSEGVMRAIFGGKIATKGVGLKLSDMVDSALGRGTRTSHGEYRGAGGGAPVDLHVATSIGGMISPGVLRNLARRWSGGKLNGIQIRSFELLKEGSSVRAALVHLDDGTTVGIKADFSGRLSPTQYEKLLARHNRVAQELNKARYGGGKWDSKQLQSVARTQSLLKRGFNPQFPEWSWARHTSEIPFEVTPSSGNAIGKVYGEGLDSLPIGVQNRISHELATRLSQELQSRIGGSLRVQGVRPVRTFSNGRWRTGMIIKATGSPVARAMLADALGLIAEQDHAYSVTFERGKKLAGLLRGAGGLPLPNEAFAQFAASHPNLVEGAFLTDRGHMLTELTPKKYNELESAFVNWAEKHGIDGRISWTRHASRYHKHEWRIDPQGQSYKRRLQDRGGTRLVRDLMDLRRRYPGFIEEAYRRYAPGRLDPRTRSRRIEAANRPLNENRSNPALESRRL